MVNFTVNSKMKITATQDKLKYPGILQPCIKIFDGFFFSNWKKILKFCDNMNNNLGIQKIYCKPLFFKPLTKLEKERKFPSSLQTMTPPNCLYIKDNQKYASKNCYKKKSYSAFVLEHLPDF